MAGRIGKSINLRVLEAMKKQAALKLWPVYQNTLDFPGKFVAREFVGGQPTETQFADAELKPVHDWVFEQACKAGLGSPVRMDRDPSDDPCLMYTFI